MKFLCKIFGHKMYDMDGYGSQPVRRTICERCEKLWVITPKKVEVVSHE